MRTIGGVAEVQMFKCQSIDLEPKSSGASISQKRAVLNQIRISQSRRLQRPLHLQLSYTKETKTLVSSPSHTKTRLAHSQHTTILYIDDGTFAPLPPSLRHTAPRPDRGSLLRQTTTLSTLSHEHDNHRKHVSR
jgi:hypothetical protein